MTEHTPTPYVVVRGHGVALGVGTEIPRDGKCRIFEMIGNTLTEHSTEADHKAGLLEANAAFIVLACNSHASLVEQRDALLEACRGLMATIDHESQTGLCQGSEWVRVKDTARSAIALAKAPIPAAEKDPF